MVGREDGTKRFVLTDGHGLVAKVLVRYYILHYSGVRKRVVHTNGFFSGCW